MEKETYAHMICITQVFVHRNALGAGYVGKADDSATHKKALEASIKKIKEN